MATEGVADADRLAAVGRLQELVGAGTLSLERFSGALEQVLAARSHEDLESAMVAMPSLVRLTPVSRQLQHPLRIDVGIGRMELGAGWQLGQQTSISTSTGSCELDLTRASWDAPEVDLELDTATGRIEVVIPPGVAVQMVSAKGRIRLKDLADPVPGAPLLRVTACASTGQVIIRHPRPARRRWGRRRRQA